MSLLYLAVHLWEWWYYDHHVFLIAIHISTEDNEVTDTLSRLTIQRHEWELDTPTFLTICE